jgi:hypothetical protein
MFASLNTGKFEKQNQMGELHYGAEGPHRTLVPSNRKMKTRKRKKTTKKRGRGRTQSKCLPLADISFLIYFILPQIIVTGQMV